MHEREIIEAIENNVVNVVCGETGSGKSTQIPQFLLQLGYGLKEKETARPGLVGITQPRRVAAVSLAKRVSDELGTKLGQEVGYQIRYDAKFVSEKITRAKFMTDGILLKEIQNDFLLRKYSIIVIDEAHERSLNSDILIGLLTRISELRLKLSLKERQEKNQEPEFYPLRLLIMSATLKITDFTENERLFIDRPKPQVINV